MNPIIPSVIDNEGDSFVAGWLIANSSSRS